MWPLVPTCPIWVGVCTGVELQATGCGSPVVVTDSLSKCCPGVPSLRRCVRVPVAPCWPWTFLGCHFGGPHVASAPRENETLTCPFPPGGISVPFWGKRLHSGFAWERFRASRSFLEPKLQASFLASICVILEQGEKSGFPASGLHNCWILKRVGFPAIA